MNRPFPGRILHRRQLEPSWAPIWLIDNKKEDEFFLALDGKLIVDIEGADSVEMGPQQGYVVPKGVVHRTRAPEKTVILMIETAGIVPTGDAD